MKKLFLFFFLLPCFSFKPTANGKDIFFGDSITFGNELGTDQYTGRWSTQYCRAVPSDEVNDAYSGAAMTPGLNAGRPVFDINQVPTYQSSYRHIFISYWVNDYLYGGTPAAYASATTNAVNGIIAKGWPAAKIVLCFNFLPASPGTWIDMTDAKAQQWLAALRSVQQARGTSFLDFYTLIRNRSDNTTYSPDLIHPTVEWNTIMTQYAETNIEGPTSTLPVTLVNFSGQRQASSTVLNWTVAQEQNVLRYEINRSGDGANWTRAGEVNSLGNAAAQRSYSFVDNSAAAGKQYYRLRTVDQNGAFKFSNIIIVNGVKTSQLSLGGLFPNPVAATLNLVVNAPAKENVTVYLFDVLGRQVKTQQQTIEAGANTVDVNVSRMRSGTYVVKLISENEGVSAVERFVKE